MKFSEKLKSFFGIKNELTDEFFDDLLDLLVEGDFGVSLASQSVEELQVRCKKEKITTPEKAKELFRMILHAYIANSVREDNQFRDGALNVILLLGVNGVGKTTTAAKLACLFSKEAKPLLAAGDTFRAAAIDQLVIHGERLGVRVVAHKQHGDTAAVIYDALEAARAGNYNPLIADTAGRMHTKSALVEELKKIDRVIERFKTQDGSAKAIHYLKYLVLDATTGSNAFVQAETFSEAIRIDGVVLTKMDSSAKGGIVFALAAKLCLPVLFICDGEKYENLKDFDAEKFIQTFLGFE
ncbi:MAG: signal recognition particle-docking protein FtsY [Spirochaetaceae bacterium]|jgi:fused signal recognition particle receptor|nr:signal recognition particle-docking protein FtsY [Spirochaetaceae bacterium]